MRPVKEFPADMPSLGPMGGECLDHGMNLHFLLSGIISKLILFVSLVSFTWLLGQAGRLAAKTTAPSNGKSKNIAI